jgi:hypothetical protein
MRFQKMATKHATATKPKTRYKDHFVVLFFDSRMA